MKRYWKNVIACSIVLFLGFLGSQAIASEQGAGGKNWGTVAEEVIREQDKALKDAAETERRLKMDKAELQKEYAELKATAKQEEDKLEKLRKEFATLKEQEDVLKQELSNEKEEIEAIEGNVRGAAKDAVSTSRDNPVTAQYPERTREMQALVDMRQFPGMPAIKQLVEFFFQEMMEEGQIVRRTGAFIGPDGRGTTGDIVRVGRFTTYYRMKDGKVGFLLPDATGEKLVAITGEVPYSIRKRISAFIDGKSDIGPIDPSAGGSFAKLTEKVDLRDWLESGGVFMYAILAVGVLGIVLGVERLISLGTKARASDKVMEKIKGMISSGSWQDARDFCQKNKRVPTCQMIDGVIEHTGHKEDVLENALQEAILKHTPKLERGLTTLALLAAVAPLLGLLGTVTGMITTFKVITEVGTGDPGMMAGGISEALLTTQFGLMVAVPIMFIHHFFQRKVERILGDMQEKGTAFAVTLLKNNGH
ncbi:MAG: MotA/TolQ/ExbB proton channel family protein [Desulfobacteraceae bacterium]|jgi:biopolymer transport protein ExbB